MLAREDPAQRVTVRLAGADGEEIVSYDAAVVDENHEGDVVTRKVLVEDSVLLPVTFTGSGDEVTLNLGLELLDTTNSQVANSLKVMLALAGSQELHLQRGEQNPLRFSLNIGDGDQLARWRIHQETTEDLAVIGAVDGTELPIPTAVSPMGRIIIRAIRLTREGLWTRYPGTRARVSQDLVGHKVVPVNPAEFDFGGVHLTTPQLVLWHPNATWEPVLTDDQPDPSGDHWFCPPPGERLFLGDPSLLNPGGQVSVALWNLTGIPEPAVKRNTM
ncbi:MAG: hypothetical protein WA892_05975 [Ornithinimicrobium sp.]